MVRFREILKLLSEQGLDYVVIGGVAAVLHGSPMGTLDVDVCIAINDQTLPKILDALRPYIRAFATARTRCPCQMTPSGCAA